VKTCSDVAAVGAVLTICGLWLIAATVSETLCVTVVWPSPSVIVKLFSPACALVGVPVSVAVPSPLSVSVSHSGRFAELIVSVSASSASVAVMLWLNSCSDVAAVGASLVNCGA
jgi:hypothetical protein